MKKVFVGLVSAIALASISLTMAGEMTSTAASDDQSSTSGLFVSGNLGLGSIINGYKGSDFVRDHSYSFRNYGFAWAANLGYMFNQYVGLEAGYQTFGLATATATRVAGGASSSMTTTFGGFDGVVKGVLPVSNAFDLFAKVGTVDMHARTTGSIANVAAVVPSASTWMPLVGVGAAYNVNSNVAVTLQDDYAFKTHFTSNSQKLTMPAANDVLAGVSYTFSM